MPDFACHAVSAPVETSLDDEPCCDACADAQVGQAPRVTGMGLACLPLEADGCQADIVFQHTWHAQHGREAHSGGYFLPAEVDGLLDQPRTPLDATGDP